jgi:beta-lactamase class A
MRRSTSLPGLVAGTLVGVVLVGGGCVTRDSKSMSDFQTYELTDATPCDPTWQARLEAIDGSLRAQYGMDQNDVAIGVLDLKTLRLAMIRPDAGVYAASVPKIGILLAWMQLRFDAAAGLEAMTRHELGRMIKASNNEAATRFSRDLGLKAIQQVLNAQGFYDRQRGGGLWVGKHYGQGGERHGDPVGDNSHAATVRQMIRFYLLLAQDRLVSSAASRAMRDVFLSPDIPHDQIKFVQGLAGRDLTLLRKWGTWEHWRHDSALVTGPDRQYILVGLTHHPHGDRYLADLAREVDDAMQEKDQRGD